MIWHLCHIFLWTLTFKHTQLQSHLRHSLLFLFHQNKKAVKAHRLLVETYSEHAPVIRTCETWFRQFKSGDLDLTDNEHPGAH